MRFKSEEPDIYLSIYAYGDIEIKKREHIGVIKDVVSFTKSIYLYTIITIPVRWICVHVSEVDIIEKLTKEQLRNENLGFLELPDGINEVPACMCEH